MSHQRKRIQARDCWRGKAVWKPQNRSGYISLQFYSSVFVIWGDIGMRRIRATDVKIDVDDTGGLISFDWECPYCHMTNYAFTFSGNVEALSGDFQTDQECEYCGKSATVECCDPGSLF